MAEVKAIKDFFDRNNDMKLMTKGEVFEAEPERAALSCRGLWTILEFSVIIKKDKSEVIRHLGEVRCILSKQKQIR